MLIQSTFLRWYSSKKLAEYFSLSDSCFIVEYAALCNIFIFLQRIMLSVISASLLIEIKVNISTTNNNNHIEMN